VCVCSGDLKLKKKNNNNNNIPECGVCVCSGDLEFRIIYLREMLFMGL